MSDRENIPRCAYHGAPMTGQRDGNASFECGCRLALLDTPVEDYKLSSADAKTQPDASPNALVTALHVLTAATLLATIHREDKDREPLRQYIRANHPALTPPA